LSQTPAFDSLDWFAKVISEPFERASWLRLAEARSGPRVCDPQQASICGNGNRLKEALAGFVFFSYRGEPKQRAAIEYNLEGVPALARTGRFRRYRVGGGIS